MSALFSKLSMYLIVQELYLSPCLYLSPGCTFLNLFTCPQYLLHITRPVLRLFLFKGFNRPKALLVQLSALHPRLYIFLCLQLSPTCACPKTVFLPECLYLSPGFTCPHVCTCLLLTQGCTCPLVSIFPFVSTCPHDVLIPMSSCPHLSPGCTCPKSWYFPQAVLLLYFYFFQAVMYKLVRCQVSHVMCHMSGVTCHL